MVTESARRFRILDELKYIWLKFYDTLKLPPLTITEQTTRRKERVEF
jgi:hypothetical protein